MTKLFSQLEQRAGLKQEMRAALRVLGQSGSIGGGHDQQQGWLRGYSDLCSHTEPWTQKGLVLGLKLYYHYLEILNFF